VLLFALLAAQSLSVVADLVVNGHPRIYTLQPSTWINGGLILVAAAVVWWPFPLRSPRRPTTAQSGTDPIPTDAALTSTA
jgi:hypothetical protein